MCALLLMLSACQPEPKKEQTKALPQVTQQAPAPAPVQPGQPSTVIVQQPAAAPAGGGAMDFMFGWMMGNTLANAARPAPVQEHVTRNVTINRTDVVKPAEPPKASPATSTPAVAPKPVSTPPSPPAVTTPKPTYNVPTNTLSKPSYSTPSVTYSRPSYSTPSYSRPSVSYGGRR